jgi:hypothetical protein
VLASQNDVSAIGTSDPPASHKPSTNSKGIPLTRHELSVARKVDPPAQNEQSTPSRINALSRDHSLISVTHDTAMRTAPMESRISDAASKEKSS